ncbi:MAG: FAD-binding protein, partial [SAR324 cluster bacterium]|nr:FAD-binding protein [SAR324 cluster bacterium]
MSSPVPFSEAARSRLVRWISAIVGAEHVQHRKADRFVYGYDASIFRGSDVLAIAFPATVEEVAALVRLAAREGLPFVARGAGTGINGGALSQEAALVIEL